MLTWLTNILNARTLQYELQPILCALPFEIDGLRHLLGHQNLYKIKYVGQGQLYIIKPWQPGEIRCPPSVSAERCGRLGSFADNAD